MHTLTRQYLCGGPVERQPIADACRTDGLTSATIALELVDEAAQAPYSARQNRAQWALSDLLDRMRRTK